MLCHKRSASKLVGRLIRSKFRHRKQPATLPGSKGFQAAHTSYGVFLVALTDMKPYANGYKGHSILGNPFSVGYQGAEIK